MTPVQIDYSNAQPSIDANTTSIQFFNTQYTFKQELTASLATQPFITQAATYVTSVLLPLHLNWLKATLVDTTATFVTSAVKFIDFYTSNPASPFPDMNTYNSGITGGWSFIATVSTIWNASTNITYQTWSYNTATLANISANPGSTFNGVATVSTANLQFLSAANDRIVFLSQYINADPRQGQTVANYTGPGIKYEAAGIQTAIQSLQNQIVFYSAKMSMLTGLS